MSVIHDHQSWLPTEWGPVRWMVAFLTTILLGWGGWVSKVLMDISEDHRMFNTRMEVIEGNRFTDADGYAIEAMIIEHERAGHPTIDIEIRYIKEQLARIERGIEELKQSRR